MKRKLISFVTLALCVTFSIGAAISLTFENSALELKRGNYKSAKLKIEMLAEMGHSKSQVVLGEMYADGLGVPRDRNEAIRWFQRADGDQHSVACIAYHVGTRFLGRKSPQDVNEAAWWLQIAKEGGCSDGR